MRRFSRKGRSAVAAAVLLLTAALSGNATAEILGTIDLVHDGYGASNVVDVWGGGLSEATIGVGLNVLNKSDGTGEGEFWGDGPIPAFCIELSEAIPEDDIYPYDVVPVSDAQNPTTFLGGTIGTAKADYISELWGRFYDPTWAQPGPYLPVTDDAAAAFAAAIWEIVYEDLPGSPASWDVASDGTAGPLGFRIEGIDVNRANTWLHSLDGQGPHADLRAFAYNGAQDFVAQVPEPATIVILGIGAASLVRRRRVRQ